MSLWKNNDAPTSAPKWYARQCLFTSKCAKESGLLDLKDTNTQFETGDCVVYLSSNPIEGLTSKEIYFLRKVGEKTYKIFTTKEQAVSESDEGIVAISPSEEETAQLFVKYDRKDVTDDGFDAYTLIPIDVTTAKLKIDGMVSPGWYRYRKFNDSDNHPRIHLELLCFVKSMTLSSLDEEPEEVPEVPEDQEPSEE